MGELGRAIEILKKAVSLKPDNFELLNDIGVLCFQSQNHEEALEYLEQAVTINPGYKLAMINMGYVHMATGKLSQTKKILDKLEAQNPYDPEVSELKTQYQGRSHEMSDVQTTSPSLTSSLKSHHLKL